MSLRPCPNCLAMISPYARRCPQCGEPHPHATQRQKVIGILLVVAFAIAAFAFVAYKQSESENELREFQRQHHLP